MSESIWGNAISGHLADLEEHEEFEDEDFEIDLAHIRVTLSPGSFLGLTVLAAIGIAATLERGIRLLRT